MVGNEICTLKNKAFERFVRPNWHCEDVKERAAAGTEKLLQSEEGSYRRFESDEEKANVQLG